MKLFETSPGLIIIMFYENLKIDFLNSFFLKSCNNSRGVTGSSFNHVSHILCIFEIAPI